MSFGAEPSAARPALEVADIVRDFGAAFRRQYLVTPDQAAVLRALVACRTAALGGHLDACDGCGYTEPSYNSCRNRHCPKCQGSAQIRWIERRAKRVLPVGHFHVVFTIPDSLHRLAAFRREAVFHALFAAASETLMELGRTRLKGELGLTMVLHTWTRDLRFHPHIHAIVTGGGLSTDGDRWLPCLDFLAPVRMMGALYRGKLMAQLRTLHAEGVFDGFDDFRDPAGFGRLMAKVARKRWVVYAKRPFGRVEHVIGYLGRYTHRVGISNRRLLSRRGEIITLATKAGGTATVTGVEFLRRFLQHVLPLRFVKIRHYGLYASTNVDTKLARARATIAPPVDADPAPEIATVHRDEIARFTENYEGRTCPQCGLHRLVSRPLPPPDTS